MLIKKKEAKKFKIPGGTKGLLFPSSPKKDQAVAYVEMDGVYPKGGYSFNDKCTETFFLLEGKMTVEISGKKYKMNEGDLVMVLPKNKYRTKGKGKILDLITPAWDSKQNHILEK